MTTVLIFGLLVGLDNLQLASALGLMGLNARRRWLVTCAFAFFECTMPLVGLYIGHKLNDTFSDLAHWIGPGILLCLGLYIIVSELLEKERKNIANQLWVMFSLPFLMSLDNLVAGVGLGAGGYPVLSTAVVVGACAGSMCFIGLLIGEKLRGIIPGNIEMVSGLYLIGLAIFSMFET